MTGRPATANPARILVLFAVFFIARIGLLGRLDAPTFGWRPTDLASIAINYYRNGFHFAYPQVMWGGAGAGHVEMEFPLQPFVTALLFKIFGMHDWVCVLLPLTFGFGIVWVVWEFGRYLFGVIAGFAAALNIALSPTLVYITTTGMWPDPPMVFFGTLGLYLLTRWSSEGGSRQLWGGVASVALAILFKLTALYLGFPVLWLFMRRHGRDFWKAPGMYLAGAATVLPALFWYTHAYQLYWEDGNTFGIIAAGYLKFPTLALLKDTYVYKHTLIRIAGYHLTPLGFAAFVCGLFQVISKKQVLMMVWLGALVLHTFVVWAGIEYGGHIGYLLPILPACNLIGGLGFQNFVQAIRERAADRWRPSVYGSLLVVLSALVAVDAGAASTRFNGRDLAFETALWQKKKMTGLAVRRVTRPGSLIIVVDDEMDRVDQKHSMTPPDVFFFGDRRGWYLSLAWLSIDRIERLRAEGAEYFVVSLQSVQKFEAAHAEIHDYLDSRFRKVADGDGIIYALNGQ
jgi:Dolichyl-phosphate-mannose-protein mannosyltransferase